MAVSIKKEDGAFPVTGLLLFEEGRWVSYVEVLVTLKLFSKILLRKVGCEMMSITRVKQDQIETTEDVMIEQLSSFYGFEKSLIQTALKKKRVPLLWISTQDCTGCIESLIRSNVLGVERLLTEWISLEYSELLASSSGTQLEETRENVMEQFSGDYLLVIEGSIPLQDEFLMVGGRSVKDVVVEAAKGAKAVFAFGSCSSWGGISAAKPNPTGSVPVTEVVKDVPVVLVPGCPPIAEVMVGALLHLLIYDNVPELDKRGRPRQFYQQTVHQKCHRKPFFDEGLFAESYDDEGAKRGYCLFKLGCKGPSTFNACETIGWNGISCSPIGAGTACIGCSEKNFWDRGSLCSRKTRA